MGIKLTGEYLVIFWLLMVQPADGCPDGWSEYSNSCYKAFTLFAHEVNKTHAQDFCNTMSAELPIIRDWDTNNFVSNLLPDFRWAWLALNDSKEEGVFKWVDGTSLTFQAWSEPTNDDDMDCVTLSNQGYWFNTYCDTPNYFICDRPKDLPYTPCPEGWDSFSDNCYKAFTSFEYSVTISEASTSCADLSANLPIIKDMATNIFVASLIPLFTDVWLGLNYSSEQQAYQWADGSALTFKYWITEPSNPETMPCVTIGFDTYWYHDYMKCGFRYGYICVKPKEATTTTTTTSTTTSTATIPTTTTTTPTTTTSTATTTTTTTPSTTTSTSTTSSPTTTTTTTSTTTTSSTTTSTNNPTTTTTPTTTVSSDMCSWELACKTNNRKKRNDIIGGFRKVRRNGCIFLIPEREFVKAEFP